MRLTTFLAAIVGTTLEYFDFLLFTHFSFILTPLFFPTANTLLSSIFTLGIFAAGFIARPIGGLLFGVIGDCAGRKKSLTRAILWITLPTFFIGCMPSYQEIGGAATIALVICRIVQGLSVGGELPNAGIFLMEHVTRKKRGFYSGLLMASGSIGSLAALGCVYLVLRTGTAAWAWRLPFLLSSLLGILAYKLRRYLNETPEYLQLSSTVSVKDKGAETSTWLNILSKQKAFFTTIGFGALSSALIWIPTAYTNFYLTNIAGWKILSSMPMVIYALLSHAISLVFMGYLGDRIGYLKVMKSAALATILCTYPLFYALTSNQIMLAQLGFSLLCGAFSAPIHAVVLTLYPTNERCRAISVGSSAGICLGGTSPLIAASLVNFTGNQLSPSFYIILLAILGLWAVQHYKPYEILHVNSLIRSV